MFPASLRVPIGRSQASVGCSRSQDARYAQTPIVGVVLVGSAAWEPGSMVPWITIYTVDAQCHCSPTIPASLIEYCCRNVLGFVFSCLHTY